MKILVVWRKVSEVGVRIKMCTREVVVRSRTRRAR